MRVLVGCEFSGTVRNAFAERGHTAWSCDLIESDDNNKFHMICDVMDALKAGYDLAILHPPCTCLCVSGNSTYGTGMPKNSMRVRAIEWTHMLWETAKKFCNKVCLENPVGVLNSRPGMPRPSYVQPYMFGHPESKKTGLWLHNLEPLAETDNVKHVYDSLPKNERMRLHYLPPSKDRWKIRSKTFDGIAKAMAQQWG